MLTVEEKTVCKTIAVESIPSKRNDEIAQQSIDFLFQSVCQRLKWQPTEELGLFFKESFLVGLMVGEYMAAVNRQRIIKERKS